MSQGRTIRIAAMSDVHYAKDSAGKLQKVFQQVAEEADVCVICGDLTDYGLPEEARVFAKDLAGFHVPVVGVLGNHDFESGKQAEVHDILTDAGMKVLDGDSIEILGVGFAGVKGFCGGFGRGALGPWGEEIIKRFVHEAVEESLKLESALARLRTPQRVAVLHYAPIRATVEGEPPEIFPYLGSSRLEEPLNRYAVSVVFHGHAHNGALEGRTANGTPVYNVSQPLLEKHMADKPPYRIVEISVDAGPVEITPVPERRVAGGERRRSGERELRIDA